MLFLVILLTALIRGAMVCALGAALAISMWIVCLLLKWPVPSFVRWGLAAGIVGLNLIWCAIPAQSDYDTLGGFYYAVGPPVADTTGWANLDHGTNVFVICIVLVAMACMGLIISFTKALFKALNKGGRAIHKAAKANSQPPQSPSV